MTLRLKVGLKGDKGFILEASVLDIAVSVPSTWSNCWPDPSLLHTTNLGPWPEATLVYSTLRPSSKNSFIIKQKLSGLSLFLIT